MTRSAAVFAFVVSLLWAAPGFAQHQSHGGTGSGTSTSGGPGVDSPPDPASVGGQPQLFSDPFMSAYASSPMPVFDPSSESARMIDLEACNSWTESSVHSPTVSAKRLGVPGKAASEYQRGCGSFKGKRWQDAEHHLRNAVTVYPDYAAAWVVLGQVLVSEQKSDEGKTACSRAKEVDPGYVASYLCLAEFAATESDWPEVAKISEQALAIDPIGNPYSLYYAAAAGFYQHQLSQAEMHAQAALKLDNWHHIPETHLLLARIYQTAGNVPGETAQLKEFLKQAANSKDAPQAKSMLAQLEAGPPSPKDSPAPAAQPGK